VIAFVIILAGESAAKHQQNGTEFVPQHEQEKRDGTKGHDDDKVAVSGSSRKSKKRQHQKTYGAREEHKLAQ
jgi:hypothetical protein